MNNKKIPELLIEQALLGELPETITADEKRKILENPEVIRRIEELKTSNKDILDKYPVTFISEQIKQRNHEYINKHKHSSRIPFITGASAIAALCLITFFIFISPSKIHILPELPIHFLHGG